MSRGNFQDSKDSTHLFFHSKCHAEWDLPSSTYLHELSNPSSVKRQIKVSAGSKCMFSSNSLSLYTLMFDHQFNLWKDMSHFIMSIKLLDTVVVRPLSCPLSAPMLTTHDDEYGVPLKETK